MKQWWRRQVGGSGGGSRRRLRQTIHSPWRRWIPLSDSRTAMLATIGSWVEPGSGRKEQVQRPCCQHALLLALRLATSIMSTVQGRPAPTDSPFPARTCRAAAAWAQGEPPLPARHSFAAMSDAAGEGRPAAEKRCLGGERRRCCRPRGLLQPCTAWRSLIGRPKRRDGLITGGT